MSIITHERLLEISGLSGQARTSTLKKALKRAGIPFRDIAGKVFTTEDALTEVLSGHAKKTKQSRPNWNALDG